LLWIITPKNIHGMELEFLDDQNLNLSFLEVRFQPPHIRRLIDIKPALNSLFKHSPFLNTLSDHFIDPLIDGIIQYPELDITDFKQLNIFSNLPCFSDDQREALLIIAQDLDNPELLDVKIKNYEQDFKDIVTCWNNKLKIDNLSQALARSQKRGNRNDYIELLNPKNAAILRKKK